MASKKRPIIPPILRPTYQLRELLLMLRTFQKVLLCAAACGIGAIASVAPAEELLPADRPIPEVVDHYIDAELQKREITPAAQAGDHEVIRRITLDLAGRIPTVAEVQAYVQSSDPNKRVQLVDRLLGLPDFALHQRNVLDQLLAGSDRMENAWREYLLVACQENRPWDVMFREMMLTEESQSSPGALGFLKSRAKDLDRMTGDTSSIFFGVDISCAKCHDHPLVSDWLQDHYFGLQSFFSRTYLTKANFLAESDEGDVKFKTTAGETKSAQLMFLTGTVITEPEAPQRSEEEKKQRKEELAKLDEQKQPHPVPQYSRRAALVDVALRPGERDFFARAAVNRVWHRLFGWGLVNPIDQMHSGNPPLHPELLDWLARDFIEHGYDLKRLIRGLVLSQAYSRSSIWLEGERPDRDLFAVANVKPLTPRQLGVSLDLASRNQATMPEIGADKWQEFIAGRENRAGRFSTWIEVPTDDFQVSVTEALYFSNNAEIVNEFLSTANDRLISQLVGQEDREAGLQMAALNVLSRPLDAEELTLFKNYLAQREDNLTGAWQQVLWAMMTSPEFRFNH